MVQYTLNYFDLRSFGESIRLLFNYVSIDFKDNRITWDAWPSYKPTTPTGKVPNIHFDGKVLSETGAILRYLGRKHNLIGANEWEAAVADAVCDHYRELAVVTRKYTVLAAHHLEGDLDQLYKEYFVPNRDLAFQYLTDVVSKSKSGFVVDSGVTWADFLIVENVTSLLNVDPEAGKVFPAVVAYQQRVYNLPQIKNYVATRKFSKF